MVIKVEQNLQSFTGNDDVCKWVKIFEWDGKPQTSKVNIRVDAFVLNDYNADIVFWPGMSELYQLTA